MLGSTSQYKKYICVVCPLFLAELRRQVGIVTDINALT